MWHRRTKVAGVLHFRVAAAGTPEWGLLLPPPKLPPSGSSRQITARRLMTTLQIKHITLRTLCKSLLTDGPAFQTHSACHQPPAAPSQDQKPTLF